jgi:hypothetical protein
VQYLDDVTKKADVLMAGLSSLQVGVLGKEDVTLPGSVRWKDSLWMLRGSIVVFTALAAAGVACV